MSPDEFKLQLVISGVVLAVSLVMILAVIRTSISTRKTAVALERTNELLEKIWKNTIKT